MGSNKSAQGIMLAITSAISFGFMPIFATYAYRSGSNAITVVFFRHFFTALFLLLCLIIRKKDIRVDRNLLYRLVFCGIVGSGATALTLFLSYQYISVGLATILHFIYPIIVMVFSFLIYGEKMNGNKIVSLILSVSGVYILIGFNLSKIHPLGVSLAIASGVFYSIYIMQIGNSRLKELESQILVFYISVFSAGSTLIYGLLTKSMVMTFKSQFIINMVGLVVVSTIGLITIAIAVKHIGSTNGAILSTFEPITSIILGNILFMEIITPNMVAGSLLIILSIYGVVIGSKNKEEKNMDL